MFYEHARVLITSKFLFVLYQEAFKCLYSTFQYRKVIEKSVLVNFKKFDLSCNLVRVTALDLTIIVIILSIYPPDSEDNAEAQKIRQAATPTCVQICQDIAELLKLWILFFFGFSS